MTNSELDTLVLRLIGEGVTIARSLSVRTEQNYRRIDKSLQRLRKRNAITYVSQTQGWKSLRPTTITQEVISDLTADRQGDTVV